MQAGTVSRLRFWGRSWGFKIYLWWNIVHFWKSYICSSKLDVQETNCRFSQLNRIWNHLVGHWTEIGWCAALELWDLIVSVLGNISRVSDRSGKPESDDHKHHKSHNKIDVMKDIDAVPSNVQSARQEALLYVFEDNEAVIKMIIKGRSPTMRHVPRTHSVAFDWLFDRINLDPKYPNQVHRHQKPTRRHANQGKLHTWWMEPSFVFV